MALELYKPDEATKSRGGIAVLLGALLLYGVVSLYDYLAMDFWQDDLTKGMLGDEFPISPRVILCMVMMIAFAIGIYATVNHKKAVDFLIATENEMQKVSWPSKSEVISNSIVVIICTIILAIYLGGVDYLIVLFKNTPNWDSLWDKIFGTRA